MFNLSGPLKGANVTSNQDAYDLVYKDISVKSENRNASLYPNPNNYSINLNTNIKKIYKAEIIAVNVPAATDAAVNITNSTNGIIPSSILGNPANPMDNANATTRYAWDVTTLTFGSINSISLQYRGTLQTVFSVASLNVQVQNYQEICNSLYTFIVSRKHASVCFLFFFKSKSSTPYLRV